MQVNIEARAKALSNKRSERQFIHLRSSSLQSRGCTHDINYSLAAHHQSVHIPPGVIEEA